MTEVIRKQLTCSICTELLHECVTVMPCFHSFCGGCLSVWAYEEEKTTCPECRGPFSTSQVLANRQVVGMVDAMIAENPALQTRSKEEIAKLSSKNRFKNQMNFIDRSVLRGVRSVGPNTPAPGERMRPAGIVMSDGRIYPEPDDLPAATDTYVYLNPQLMRQAGAIPPENGAAGPVPHVTTHRQTTSPAAGANSSSSYYSSYGYSAYPPFDTGANANAGFYPYYHAHQAVMPVMVSPATGVDTSMANVAAAWSQCTPVTMGNGGLVFMSPEYVPGTLTMPSIHGASNSVRVRGGRRVSRWNSGLTAGRRTNDVGRRDMATGVTAATLGNAGAVIQNSSPATSPAGTSLPTYYSSEEENSAAADATGSVNRQN